LVVLAGEPGVGKTRLAQEVTLALRDRGFVVASGRCYEPQQTVPFYPFLEALETLYSAASPPERSSIPQRWPYLGRLLPNEILPVPPNSFDGREELERLFWSVTGLVQTLAEGQPVAVLLDDLHWADASSLALLQHLARHTRAYRVLLLGIYRDVEVGRRHPLEVALRDLSREQLADRVAIRRLRQDGTAALIAATFGQELSVELAELIHRHTEGNPFFTSEILQALVERGDVYQENGRWKRREFKELSVPESVRSAIGERLSRLREETQHLLYEASVLGQAFAFEHLQAMGNHGEDEVEAALAEAGAGGLVRATGKDEYCFNHALTQQALVVELAPRRKRRLHLAAGEALERLPEPVRQTRAAELAWHFVEADKPERALPYSMLAGDGAEVVFAHAEAEQHYRAALELAQQLGDTRRQAEALHKLGAVLRVLTRYEEALEAADRAVKLYLEQSDYDGVARTITEVAFVHYYRGAADRGIARVEAVIEQLERLPAGTVSSRATGEVYTALGFGLWHSARYSETLAAAERAEEMAGVGKTPRALGTARTLQGMALTMIGALADARRVLEEALSFFDVAVDPWWVTQPWAYLGRAYLDEGAPQNGLRGLEQSRALIEGIHDQAEMVWIVGCLGELSYVRGDWSKARNAYGEAIHLARDIGSDLYLSWVLLHRAELCSAEGDREQATQDIDEALDIAIRCAAVTALRKGQRLLAERDLVEGHPRSAIDRLQPLLDRAIGEWPRAFPPPVLAEAYLHLGDVAKAEELVLQRVQRFRAQNHRRALAVWLRVHGMVLGHQCNWDEVDRVLAEATSLAHGMPYPYAEGRILYEEGVLCVQRGKPERARERLAEAVAIFRRLAARPGLERAEHALRSLA
jgi:tetratricopeptide (TPR) repeat protein